MDKSKSEKLKEILSKKLTNEDIEKRLKEEAHAIQEKHIQEAQQKNVESIEKKQEEEIEEKQKEEDVQEEDNVVIPSVREEEVEHKESNFLLYLVSIIAIFLLILTIYLFTKEDPKIDEKSFEKKENQLKQNDNEAKIETPRIREMVKDEILKSLEIEKTTQTEKIETIKELPKKDESINKISENIEIKEAQAIQNPLNEEVSIEKEKETLKEETRAEEPKEKVIIKEKIVTKVVPLDRKNFKQYYNSSKFNTLKCYNFKAGNILPDAQCKKDLKKFLKDNEDAIRFQVIPVISEDDNTIFNKIKPNLSGVEQSFQDKVKEYMFRGLGRERVLETSWQIKHIVGNDVILTPTNYYVESKKNNKGVIIKAYY